MPRIPFAEYAPDISDNESSVSHDITNCLPQGDGYGPVNYAGYTGVVSMPSNVLPAACRGFFSAKNTDGTFNLFAGTNTKIYFWNTGLASWQDYSFLKGGISTSTTTAPSIVNAGTLSATSTTTAQTFTSVPVTGGSGSGAQASVTVSSFGSANPGVTLIDITTVGTNYLTGDSISCASSNIGGVTGFSANVVALSTGATVQSYTALPSGGFWRFTQYNQTVIAVNGNNPPQQFLLGGSFTNFGSLAGSPPKANYVTAIAGFLMLSGLPAHPSRIQWSDLDNITTWTPGVGQSDFQDLTDGGNASNLAGFDLYGCVFQDECVRLLTYVGGNIVFQITKIAGGTGNSLLQPYAMCVANNMIFWASPEGFKMIQPGAGGPKFIGKERVDRTYLNDVNVNSGSLSLRFYAQGCEDPQGPRVYFTNSAAGTEFTNIYCYDYELDKWTKIVVTGTIIAPLQNSGFSTIVVPQAVGFTNSVGTTFGTLNTSSPGDVTLETAEQGTDARRIYVRGFRPITDASQVLGSASFRDIPLAPQFGGIGTVTVTANGSGTSTSPQTITGVALNGGSGSGAIASVTISSTGGVNPSVANPVTITTNGNKYLLGSVISFATGGTQNVTGATSGTYAATFTSLSSGSGLTANITFSATQVTSTTITARGSGYSPSDTLTAVSTATGFPTSAVTFTPNLADITQLTASSSVLLVSGATFEVATINTYPYLAEQVAHSITGMIPLRRDARYMRAKIRIPSAATWTYAKGVEPDGSLGGLR